jgi:hypothetical protein
MWLIEMMFQVLYRGYRITGALFGFLVMFWDVVITAMSYVVGTVIRVILIVVIEVGTLGVTWCFLVPEHSPFVAFFVFVAGETVVVFIGHDFFRALLTFSFTFSSQEPEECYSPLGDDRPVDVDVPDPLSF